MALQGEDRENFIELLRSQLVSCVVLDGTNGISEQLLISRLGTEWNLRVEDIYAKLSVQNLHDLLAIYGDKFHMRNGMVFLSNLHGDTSGIREATDLIRNTNLAKQQNQSTPQRKCTGFSSHPSFNNQPVNRQYNRAILITYDFVPTSRAPQQKPKPPRILAPEEAGSSVAQSASHSKALDQSQVDSYQDLELSKNFVLNHLLKKSTGSHKTKHSLAGSGDAPYPNELDAAVDAILDSDFSEDGSIISYS